MMIRTLLVGAVVLAAGILAGWALVRYTARLDGRADHAKAGTPAPLPLDTTATLVVEPGSNWATTPQADTAWAREAVDEVFAQHQPRCGAPGPVGMVCDREPHGGDCRHEQDGYGWWTPVVPFPGVGGGRG